jgi:uncharacterized membrane protein
MMGAQHSHAVEDRDARRPPPRWSTVALVICSVLVALGIALTWPGGDRPSFDSGGTLVSADVDAVSSTRCGDGGLTCATVLITLTSGEDEGRQQVIEYTEGDLADPRLSPGDRIEVVRYVAGDQVTYAFADVDRGRLTWVLGAVFALTLLAVARWRGLSAIAGLVISVALLVMYLLPRLLTGGAPVPTAVLCGAAIVLVVLPLAHGWSARTAAALAGTLGGLLICTALAGAVTTASHITGRSDEQVQALQGLNAQITVSGLVLCGAIIGGLGVLNDVTITQASAVFEVAAADSRATVRQLFTAGMRVGRDHISSTVYTLVLAYAGSALPLLLLFNVTSRGFGEVLTSDDLAGEIVRSWVGGVGLILAVPLTTLIAAFMARPGSVARAQEADTKDGAAFA